MIVDTHVHVFTDDRKKYPQIRDTARAGSIPSITEIGQTEWPLTTVEKLIAMMDDAGIARATLVQAYFVYEYDNRYTVDATLAHRDRFASIVVLDPMDKGAPDELSRLVEKQGVAGLRFITDHVELELSGAPEIRRHQGTAGRIEEGTRFPEPDRPGLDTRKNRVELLPEPAVVGHAGCNKQSTSHHTLSALPRIARVLRCRPEPTTEAHHGKDTAHSDPQR